MQHLPVDLAPLVEVALSKSSRLSTSHAIQKSPDGTCPGFFRVLVFIRGVDDVED